jgi:type VI secretion system protein ImpK
LRNIIDPVPTTGKEEAPFHFLAPKTATYYRSKAFVSQVNINPLIAASAPLFFLIETIQSLDTPPDIKKLHSDLTHELNAFVHQAIAYEYHMDIILAARYVMSLWIDQIILNTAWGKQSIWKNIKLTDTQIDADKNSPFFLLLKHCLQEPARYLCLLELFYLCLSLGFVDHGVVTESNHTNMVVHTRDYLFETIIKQREGYSKRLEVGIPTKKALPGFSFRPVVRLGILLTFISALIITYFWLNTLLDIPIHFVPGGS